MVQAQTIKVCPTLKKGDVKRYETVSTMKASGQEVTVTETTKYTVTEENADGYVIDAITSDWKVNADNAMSRLLVATTELFKDVNLEANGILTLNGKSITADAQDEFVNSQGMKMKRFYLVNGKNKITSAAKMNMSNEDMKKMVIEKVEQTAPEQAKMVKDNIDTLLESGMLKVEGSETATYEFAADGWVKTMTLKNDMTLMGASTNVETTVTLK